ncbi:hypothetical protein BJ742DRAFT_910132 [Cladochytrium replicatum]|nr:hypothetical protein BJ742DRAFT_910132 [Cladochytrium replicatum]
MATMRDAMRRLQIIYEACAPEALEANEVVKSMDDFARMRKQIHDDVKAVRMALKEREALRERSGTTTTESAEMSYRIRVQIRGLKESAQRMSDLVSKEDRKKRNRDEEKIAAHKEVLELAMKHIEECENLEKGRFGEAAMAERVNLLSKPGRGNDELRHRGGGGGGGGGGDVDPYMKSELPDIDVEEDLKNIGEKNKLIDDELHQIGIGVSKLKELANDMGQELDAHNEVIDDIDKNVENVLDHLDSVNLKMKKALDKMMKGDKFMVNCILVCVVLALVASIAGIWAV